MHNDTADFSPGISGKQRKGRGLLSGLIGAVAAALNPAVSGLFRRSSRPQKADGQWQFVENRAEAIHICRPANASVVT